MIDFIKKYKWQLLITLIAVLALGIGLFVYYYWYKPIDSQEVEQQPATNQIVKNQNCDNQRLLDGVCVVEGQENLPVYSIMIENHVDSRPPAGLSKANLVYEAMAEGAITRFLAVYDSATQLDRIGPVRSTRKYFVDWAQEFDSVHVHIGGSPEALDLLKVRPVYDLNEFFNGAYFWRDNNRLAPHNVYTSADLLHQAIEKKQWDIKPDFHGWQFKSEAELKDRPDSQEILIDFIGESYLVKWVYNKDDNNYQRYLGGKLHQDEDGSQITAKNIAVMYTGSSVYDDEGRRRMTTVGEGEAVVFLDGKAIEGFWKRPDLDSRTRFYDKDGNEIAFNPGITWIEVVLTHFPKVKYE